MHKGSELNMAIKCFIYARKSVDTGKGESIENQIEQCKSYATIAYGKQADAIDFHIYCDKGYSGKNTSRPEFQQMIKDIEAQRPEYLMCYRLDRVSRSVGDFAKFNDYLKKYNVSFVSINEKFDTSTPIGEAMMNISAVFAQLERGTIAERVRDNMHHLAKTGRWLGGTSPLGYTAIKESDVIIEGKVSKASRLEIKPEEAEIVRIIYSKFLETKHISAVSKYLIKEGIKNREGKDYSTLGIKDILQNPVYAIADTDSISYFQKNNADVCINQIECNGTHGLMSYNKRDYSTPSASRNPIDKWIIAVGKHKGLISGKDWVTVQDIIKANSKAASVYNHTNEHNDYSLLSGKIICGKCQSKMFAKRRTNSKYGLYDYICSSKLRGNSEHCDCTNLIGQETDDSICKMLMDYKNDNSAIIHALNKVKSNATADNLDTKIKELEKELTAIDKQRNNFMKVIGSGNANDIMIEQINNQLVELQAKEAEINEQIASIRNLQTNQEDITVQINAFLAKLATFENCYENMTIYEKRELINILIEKVVWDGETLRVFRYDE